MYKADILILSTSMAKRKINVAILMGGPSAEHEVSLHTGEQILAHLDSTKYIATPAIISKKGEWFMGRTDNKQAKLSRADVLSAIAKNTDIAFIALHGAFGEDGTVQGLLESFDIPYTGSGVLASALGMDKPRSLLVLRDNGFTVPPFCVLLETDTPASSKKKLAEIRTFGFQFVVKPSDHGSSIGVSIVRKLSDMLSAIALAKKYSSNIIVQKFIQGREVTCGVIEKGKHVVALPPVEIVPRKSKFYDYRAKYADGGSDHFIPPRNMAPKTIRMIQDTAHRAHDVIGCSGMSRTDFILGDDGNLHILEINTIPGMTSTSLLPQSAAAMGITFPKLLDMLIQNGLKK